MEAMASGLPVMTSAFSGVAELIPASMRGFRVENPTDPGEIALRLGALFDAPANLGAQARAVAGKFTWDRSATELNNFIESLKSGRAASCSRRGRRTSRARSRVYVPRARFA